MVITGDFIGRADSVSIHVVGKTKEHPVIEVGFTLIKGLQGDEYVPVSPVKVRKMWFLTTEMVTKGKFAGKSQLEVVAETLKEVFGYDGGLNEDAMKATIVGQEAKLVLGERKTDKGTYTEVKWVNPMSGGTIQKKPIAASLLAALDKEFSGGKGAVGKTATDIWGKAQ